MSTRAANNDKRNSVRIQTLMPGSVLDPKVGIVSGCLVRDFSSGGAKIELQKPLVLPGTFWLKLTGDGTLRYCTVKWRSAQQFGVEFTRDKLLQIAAEELKVLRLFTSWDGKERRKTA